MSLMKNVETVNSLVRTILALTVVGGLGYGGWFAYTTFDEKRNMDRNLADTREQLLDTEARLKDARSEIEGQGRRIAEQVEAIEGLRLDVQEKQKTIQRLDTALRLLKVDHRLARITVLDQGTDEERNEPYTVIEFQEVNDEGAPIDEPKRFRLRGDTVYVDCWIVKFDDAYVEKADLHRSTSLCLFKSVYGDLDGPSGSQALEKVGAAPKAYARGGAPSEFEKQIWSDFWNIAHDPEAARSLGIRALHGQANFTKVREGKTYRLQLRASDGLTTLPAEDAAREPKPST